MGEAADDEIDMALLYDDSCMEEDDRLPDGCRFCGGTVYNGMCSVCGEE